VVEDWAAPIWPATNGTVTRTTAASGSSRSRFSFPRTLSLSMIIAVLSLPGSGRAAHGYQLRPEQLAGVDKVGDALRTLRLALVRLGRVAVPTLGAVVLLGYPGRQRGPSGYPQPQQQSGGQGDGQAGQH